MMEVGRRAPLSSGKGGFVKFPLENHARNTLVSQVSLLFQGESQFQWASCDWICRERSLEGRRGRTCALQGPVCSFLSLLPYPASQLSPEPLASSLHLLLLKVDSPGSLARINSSCNLQTGVGKKNNFPSTLLGLEVETPPVIKDKLTREKHSCNTLRPSCMGLPSGSVVENPPARQEVQETWV